VLILSGSKKKREAPMDVFSVLQPPHARRYAFLSITFGFIANLDIGTEHLRWEDVQQRSLCETHTPAK